MYDAVQKLVKGRDIRPFSPIEFAGQLISFIFKAVSEAYWRTKDGSRSQYRRVLAIRLRSERSTLDLPSRRGSRDS